MKDKILDFWYEHKTKVIIGVSAVVVAVVGFFIVKKKGRSSRRRY